MENSQSALSHRQHLVSQIVENDPERADLLFELLVLTDSSTPEGAAAHADAKHACYVLSPDCYRQCREKESMVKAMLATYSVVLISFIIDLI
jgi:hypothetical protein